MLAQLRRRPFMRPLAAICILLIAGGLALADGRYKDVLDTSDILII